MGKKKTNDVYREEVEEKNPNLEPMESYIGCDVPILHRCKTCNYKWSVRPANIINGVICPNCTQRIKRSHEIYVAEAAGINPNVEVIEKYISRHEPILHRCKIDGYEWKPAPKDILGGGGCPVCSHKAIGPSFENSIWTSEYKNLFANYLTEEQMKITMPNSGKKISMICSDCGRQKVMSPNVLFKTHSLGCICSDGVSYPNKFMYAMLNQLGVVYQPEYTPKWSNNKRYDIYIPLLNCIIENHGGQHYQNTFRHSNSRTFEEEQENDNYKEKLAINNGITEYIVLDCRQSDCDWIKNSIINSGLSDIFDLSIIDWIQCQKFACSNLVKMAAELWNNGFEVYTIAKEMCMSKNTIVRYLKRAAKCGMCDYTKENSYKRMGEGNKGSKHSMARLTIQLTIEDKIVEAWKCMTDAGDILNINMKLISSCCLGTHKSAGGYHWKFLYDTTRKNGEVVLGAISLGLITKEEFLQLVQQNNFYGTTLQND